MKLFLSWSGEVSYSVALVLRDWLPVVLPFVEPWVSSEDIPKGIRWGAELASKLEDTHSGIVCLVPGNLGEPWLNFEAGALSKTVQKARIHPFLFGVDTKDLTGPLSQFQATPFTKEDVKKLVTSINAEAGDKSLPARKLDGNFQVCWANLEDRLKPLLTNAKASGTTAKADNPRETRAVAKLTKEEIQILLAVANAGHDGLRKEPAAEMFGMHPERAAHIMEKLESLRLLSPAHNYLYGTAWHLTKQGRAFLVEGGLIG